METRGCVIGCKTRPRATKMAADPRAAGFLLTSLRLLRPAGSGTEVSGLQPIILSTSGSLAGGRPPLGAGEVVLHGLNLEADKGRSPGGCSFTLHH